MIPAIIIIAIILILIVAFVTWFLAYIADGKCPICALKSFPTSKLSMDLTNDEDYDNNAPKTPIMGWSSWNTLRNHIDQDAIIDTAKAMRDTGLLHAGYEYINIDDCWQSSMRDADGKLQGDLESFPMGMENLCKTLNSIGMKMGLYTSNGTLTCEDLPASLGNEVLDARTLASWGVEYFKYDFCHHEYISGSTPAIEYIDLNLKGERASIKLRPEDAKFTGRARIIKIKELPTGKAIANLNHNAGTATFTFNAPVGGEYGLTVHFHKTTIQRKQYMQVTVNGEMHEVFFPAGRSFTPDGRAQISIKLTSGHNTIVLSNPVVTRADSSFIQYRRMATALKNATNDWAMITHTEERPITFSICEWGFARPWKWGAKAGNMWRTTMDITPNWTRIMQIYNRNITLYKHSSPGHVNDPDMLEVGNGKLTKDENKSHFTLWCMMAAPLVLGNDLRLLLDGSEKSNSIIDIVTNKNLIDVDQDALVKPAMRIKKLGSLDILARPLENGDIGICFFNRGSSNARVDYKLSDLRHHKYLNAPSSLNNAYILDLWSNESVIASSIKTTVPKHGVQAYRITNQGEICQES